MWQLHSGWAVVLGAEPSGPSGSDGCAGGHAPALPHPPCTSTAACHVSGTNSILSHRSHAHVLLLLPIQQCNQLPAADVRGPTTAIPLRHTTRLSVPPHIADVKTELCRAGRAGMRPQRQAAEEEEGGGGGGGGAGPPLIAGLTMPTGKQGGLCSKVDLEARYALHAMHFHQAVSSKAQRACRGACP